MRWTSAVILKMCSFNSLIEDYALYLTLAIPWEISIYTFFLFVAFLDAQDTTLCPTPGCRGIGHVKGAKYTTHHSIFGCPYSPNNVTRGSPLVDRLANNSMGEESSIASRVYNCKVARNGEGKDQLVFELYRAPQECIINCLSCMQFFLKHILQTWLSPAMRV